MLKAVGWLALTAAAILFPIAVLAAYDVTGSSPPATFRTGSGSEAPASATVEIHPETLNPKSHGRWVTAYIELPQGLDVANIDVATVRLCLGELAACPEDASVPAGTRPTAVGDYDHDGVLDRMVKFDRASLVHLLGGLTGDLTMTVTGMVTPPGQAFGASDTIRVIGHGCGGAADAGLCVDEELPEDATLSQATPTAEPTPVPEATPLPEPAVPTFEYQVQSGDTLFDIALRFGTTVEVLMQLNALSSAQVVWVGQVLSVPEAAPTPSPAPPDVPTVEYTVRPGESLWDVAAFFGTTVETIAALNGLTDPGLVVPGQRLLVPAPPPNTAPGREFLSEYVVQPGETLTDIAARFGTTVEALAAENGLANPSAIRIGDRLRVP